MSDEWKEVNAEILSELDIKHEYRELGLEITGSEPNAEGWLACRAMGREDRNPSAAINVKSGRYKDHGGEGESLSLFEFAAAHGPYLDWRDARRAFAQKVGVKLPRGREARPDGKLKWIEWNPAAAAKWCQRKTGTTEAALNAAGAKMAIWKDGRNEQVRVLAFPVYGALGVNADPTGWVFYSLDDDHLYQFQRNGSPKEMRMLSAKGSKAGWIGHHGLLHIERAELVWVVEGAGDLLALCSVIPDDLKTKHVVLSNSNGANENPKRELLAMLKGKRVYVVRDADKAARGGQRSGRQPHRRGRQRGTHHTAAI
ncbi:MAG: hypothetical protein R3C10_26850 [Pirellulales bacterium]